jgi:ankyrin repeat protein
MHVRMCALPQHDSLLTPPLQQHEMTPLFISAEKGHTNTVLALLQAGAAVDAKDKWGDTALDNAKEKQHAEVVAILRAAGARE